MILVTNDLEVQLQGFLEDIMPQQEVYVVECVLWLQLDVPPVRSLRCLWILLCKTLCPL